MTAIFHTIITLASLFLILNSQSISPNKEIAPKNLRPKPLLETLEDGKLASVEQCVNLGSWNTIGPFRSERKFVQYSRGDTSISVSVPNQMVDSSKYPSAFRTRRVGGIVAFLIRPAYPTSNEKVSLALGFAQFIKCAANMRSMNVNVSTKDSVTVDVFQKAGCGRPFYLNFSDVSTDKDGLLKVRINKVKGAAHISVLCLRGTGSGPVVPSTSPISSVSSTPSISITRMTPTPTESSAIRISLSPSASFSTSKSTPSFSSSPSQSPTPSINIRSQSVSASPILKASLSPSSSLSSSAIATSPSQTASVSSVLSSSSPFLSNAPSLQPSPSKSYSAPPSNSASGSALLSSSSGLPSQTGTVSASISHSVTTVASPTESETVSPSPSTSVSPSSTVTLSPTINVPASRSATPSSPSSLPSASVSITSTASASSSGTQNLFQKECESKRCTSFVGRGSYKVIGNSMLYSSRFRTCILRRFSEARLDLPGDANVKLALLVWSASSIVPVVPRVRLNGISVAASKTKVTSSNGVAFYSASADVTNLVTTSGMYTVDRLHIGDVLKACENDAFYAGWSLAVLYESPSLPLGRTIYCLPRLIFTAPAGIYDFYVSCLGSAPAGKNGRVTVVAHEGDQGKGEYFYINNLYIGYNLYNGSTAPKMDILTFDTRLVKQAKWRRMRLRFWTYYTPNLFRPSVEGLLIPMYLVHDEL